jgi:3-dehydroquinate dehydratase-2
MPTKEIEMRPLFILNGPNLNKLGVREPEIYGTETLEQLRRRCEARGREHGVAIDFRQTNFEGELIEWIHDARDRAAGLIVNPTGLSFTSVSVLDALKIFEGPKVEVHITNIHARGGVYERSLMSQVMTAVLAGFGTDGYLLAIDWLAARMRGGAARAKRKR